MLMGSINQLIGGPILYHDLPHFQTDPDGLKNHAKLSSPESIFYRLTHVFLWIAKSKLQPIVMMIEKVNHLYRCLMMFVNCHGPVGSGSR